MKMFLCICQPWPEEALERVANSFLESLEMSEHERQQVMPICKTFHTSAIQLSQKWVTQSLLHMPMFILISTIRCGRNTISPFFFFRFRSELGRHNYVTPTSYLELIAAFRQLLTQKRDTVMKAKKRYTNGLDKLAFAESQVGGIFPYELSWESSSESTEVHHRTPQEVFPACGHQTL